MKKYLEIKWPILPGCVSTAKSRCGQVSCACKKRPPKLHGIYYRWTGFINGKRTTKTISKEMANTCKKQIENFRKLQKDIDILIAKSLESAPWNAHLHQNRKQRRK